MDRVSRSLLARAGEQGLLSAAAMEAALDVSGLRPGKTEWRRFAVVAMRFSAVLSLAAGMVFLIAFNWENLGIYARFGAVELPLAAALAMAWLKGADAISGKLSILLAVLLTGGLLALFGQTYQTGANLYELFFGWGALTLPWVVACRYAPCWAFWLLLLNVGIGLHAAASGTRPLFNTMIDRWGSSPWSMPYLFDALVCAALIPLSHRKELGLDARWLRRGVMAVAMALGTVAMIVRVVGDSFRSGDAAHAAAIEWLMFLVVSAGFGAYAYAQREDLFDFAVLALAWIVVTTTLIARVLVPDYGGLGVILFIALYLVGTSTAALKGIAFLGRQWKFGEAE